MNAVEKKLRDNLTLPLYPDTAEILHLGRNSAYSAAARGEIETLQFGRLLRVPTAWLRRKLGLEPAA
jgi:hypothetical protein